MEQAKVNLRFLQDKGYLVGKPHKNWTLPSYSRVYFVKLNGQVSTIYEVKSQEDLKETLGMSGAYFTVPTYAIESKQEFLKAVESLKGQKKILLDLIRTYPGATLWEYALDHVNAVMTLQPDGDKTKVFKETYDWMCRRASDLVNLDFVTKTKVQFRNQYTNRLASVYIPNPDIPLNADE